MNNGLLDIHLNHDLAHCLIVTKKKTPPWTMNKHSKGNRYYGQTFGQLIVNCQTMPHLGEP